MDANGRQTEKYYKSKCRIFGAQIINNSLCVYESGTKDYWKFSKTGKLEHMPEGSKVSTGEDIVYENVAALIGPKVLNPIRIRVAKNPKDSVILSDNNDGKDTPICPGAMFGGERYGFILSIETNDGIKKMEYPTQNKITAIGAEYVGDEYYGDADIKVYEDGKHFPWVITSTGKFKSKSAYYEISRKDKAFVVDSYKQSADTDEERFTIHPKR